MDLRLATLKAVSFCLLHNVSTLNQCRKLSRGTIVCKHFAIYQGYPNYRRDLICYAKCSHGLVSVVIK
jgi:ATP-dependent RNA circularization protein (DNA/RNA ligase family)